MNKILRNPKTHKLTESGQNDLMDNLSKIDTKEFFLPLSYARVACNISKLNNCCVSAKYLYSLIMRNAKAYDLSITMFSLAI